MAGGGVGEAMLIGAAVGAGTGGIMSAAQDKDVGQGMLLGALGGAATGGIGSGIGGAAGSAAENIAANAAANTATDVAASTATDVLANTAANSAAENTVNTLAQQGANQAASSMASTPALSSTAANINTTGAGNLMAEGASQGAQTWGQQGIGQGLFPGMTNAQVAGASTAGGISGLAAANGQPAPYEAPETETYNGPLSKFKIAGPQLSQYSYNPNTFQPSVAPGYAEGGIASLAQGGVQQAGMFPQSQMDRTQFAIPSQMPVSREIIGSDYDATINPYTGDLPRFAGGGGIDFIHNLQPGGEWGDITSDLYGVVQEHKPQWLQDMEPGGFIGATVPGKLDWEEKKRKEEEEKVAQDRAAKEAQAAAMYNKLAGGNPQASGGMARGGIADLGSYSDGGRLLRGPGDGMSDNIPASIGGKQPARLADGEFVVPADVVSHLGNGSTDAGAKTLYSMMDKVRKARTGSKKQGREIDANKYVPGMSDGGIAAFASGGSVQHYASGNLVVNPETNEVGYWSGTNSFGGPGGDWVPITTQSQIGNGLGTGATSSTGFKASSYDPNYYSPQYYQNQLSDAQSKLSSAQNAYNQASKGIADYRANSVADMDLAAANPQLNDWYLKYLGRNIEGQGALKNIGHEDAIANSAEAKAWANNPINKQYLAAQADIDSANKTISQVQPNVDRLAASNIKYDPYTLASRPSGNEPQYYGNIYKPTYENYSRPGYDMNAQLGVWNNEYGGNAAPTQRQQNIANIANEQRLAQAEQLSNSQTAALNSRNLINQSVAAGKNQPPSEEKKRRGGIASLRRA